MISPSCSHHFPTISLFCPQFDRWKPHLPRPAAEFPQFPRRWRHPILADVDAPHVDCVENRIFLCTVDINQIILYTMCIYIYVCIYTDLNVYTCMYTVHLELVWVRLICVHVIHYVSIHVLYNMYIYICMYVYIYMWSPPSMIYLEAFYMGITMLFLHIKHNRKNSITHRRGAHGGQVSALGCFNIFGL